MKTIAKVSIIIPNYNRASLISETLDSIAPQSFTDWECLIIDDRSDDNSTEIIKRYSLIDQRFKLMIRDSKSPKGANSCRNIGLKEAKGEYIIFFDSDDIMMQDHVEKKLDKIIEKNYDFVIARTEYFDNPNNLNPINYRGLGKVPITADNFITKKINWLTLDPIIKSSIAKSIVFTEKSNSAEEYNYFSKLVLRTKNGIAISDILSRRRFHAESYQSSLISEQQKNLNLFHYYYDTYFEIYNFNLSKNAKQFMLTKISELIYDGNFIYNKKVLYLEFFKNFKILKALNKMWLLEFRKKQIL